MLPIKSQGAAATALPVPAIPLHKSFATVLFAPAPSPERVLVAAKGGDHGHTPAQQSDSRPRRLIPSPLPLAVLAFFPSSPVQCGDHPLLPRPRPPGTK